MNHKESHVYKSCITSEVKSFVSLVVYSFCDCDKLIKTIFLYKLMLNHCSVFFIHMILTSVHFCPLQSFQYVKMYRTPYTTETKVF